VSDLSGDEISEGKGATVTIKFNDARKGLIVLDVTDVLPRRPWRTVILTGTSSRSGGKSRAL